MSLFVTITTTSTLLENAYADTTATNNDNDNDKKKKDDDDDDDVCGLWLAMSSIPGAGLGMYAGRNFTRGEELIPTGDLVVPVVDIPEGKKWTFLWDEYTWDSESLLMDHEAKGVDVASFGFGAAVNCFLDLANVAEANSFPDTMGLHRSRDPLAGAMTMHRNRQSTAKYQILEGQELFVSYGDNWFYQREDDMPPVPLTGDLSRGNKLVMKYKTLTKQLNESVPQHIIQEIWQDFVWKNPFEDTSRVLFGLPRTWDEIREVYNVGLKQLRRRQFTKPIEWLQQHGVCADTIREGPSDVAVRGAIATRFLPKDSIVAPFPLIHIPHKRRLRLQYKTNPLTASNNNNSSDTTNDPPLQPYQQLINYCMGHTATTMILCPYSTLTALINHHSTEANTKLRWADPSRSNHHPDWLDKSVSQIQKETSAGLAMELVATRDIQPGEEVLMDYGPEWEAAWKKHVENWKPSEDTAYQAAVDFDNGYMPIRTVDEQRNDPYPANLELRFDMAFLKNPKKWMSHWEKGTLTGYIKREDEYRRPVLVTKRFQDEDGNTWYSGRLRNKKKKTFDKVPREAFTFVDRKYSTDMHLPNAFRYPIGIPDELLPEAWRNSHSHTFDVLPGVLVDPTEEDDEDDDDDDDDEDDDSDGSRDEL